MRFKIVLLTAFVGLLISTSIAEADVYVPVPTSGSLSGSVVVATIQ